MPRNPGIACTQMVQVWGYTYIDGWEWTTGIDSPAFEISKVYIPVALEIILMYVLEHI